jgi:chemotaxis protein methyltransferase CheR
MRRLAQAIGAYAGLDPPPWLLEARVRERAEELGLAEADYLERVERDAGERACLLERLRVGETRFFRHQAQIDALRTILPSLFQDGELVRVWSAGCATGEEVYTLALLLDELAPREDWEVLGTDLSAAAIAAAEAGRFPAARLEQIPERHRRRLVVKGGEFSFSPSLRKKVRFERHNLVEAGQPRGLDLILCRNVLIYFDSERRAQAITRLGEALRIHGWLFLGYSETLRGREEARLEPRRIGDTVLYQRREITAPIVLPTFPDEPAPPTPPAPTPPPPHVLKLRGEYHDGARLAAELRPYLSAAAIVDLDGAHYLGDDAARVLARALGAAPGLSLKATRAPITRWLAKHGLVRR